MRSFVMSRIRAVRRTYVLVLVRISICCTRGVATKTQAGVEYWHGSYCVRNIMNNYEITKAKGDRTVK